MTPEPPPATTLGILRWEDGHVCAKPGQGRESRGRCAGESTAVGREVVSESDTIRSNYWPKAGQSRVNARTYGYARMSKRMRAHTHTTSPPQTGIKPAAQI